MDEYEKAQNDYYDMVRGPGPEAMPDPAKSERYLKGWSDAELSFSLMGRPRTIEEFKAKAAELAKEQGLL
jgi:hypothetical protein